MTSDPTRAATRRWPRLAALVAVALALPYVALVAIMAVEQDGLVYVPPPPSSITPAAVGLPYRDVGLVTSDGVRLHAWFLTAGEERAPLAVLYCHGNGESLPQTVTTVVPLVDRGLDVLLFDYRGYGRSAGHPSEEGTYRDGEAAWTWLVRERGMPPGRIVLWGHSLGGGVASELALRHADAAGLVLASTFTSAVDLGAERFPWLPVRLLARHRYPTLARLGSLHMPVVVAHARSDRVIPFHHGERLAAAANAPSLFLELDEGHENGLATAGALERILVFLDRHQDGRPPAGELIEP